MMQLPMGPMAPQMHHVMQNPPHPPPPPQQPTPAQQIELKYDNVAKVKTLIWSLKDSLANVMKVAGSNIYYTAGGKTGEGAPPRIDKTLEDFFSICNQIELHLKTIHECTLQQKESMQYLPIHVNPGKNDAAATQPPDGSLTYAQYLSTTKGQVNFAKAVQDMLTEGARKITQRD